jgi:sphinganine-1-phosphate aldolase
VSEAAVKMPAQGRAPQEVLEELNTLKEKDVRWHDGRVFCLVYHAGDEITDFIKEAYTTFFSENALNPSAFPSLRRLEVETVEMVARLLGSKGEVAGNMTSGGTESILMAMKTAREWGKARDAKNATPEVIVPTTAHPAFEKAAHYFGMRTVHVPVGPDHRADLKATQRAITKRTVMIVGSAPSYPQGVMDPIEGLAAIARQHKLLCHVDACVGGMMLPFVRAAGYPVPPFDFSVPGVTSMSVDLHKYGYAAKGASLVLYCNPELRRHQYFAYTDWPGGIYASPTMTGTRPGGAIAAAWAILNRLGHDGYTRLAAEVMQTVTKLRDGINATEGLEVQGDPVMSVMAIGSPFLNIYEVGDQMTARGWHLDRQQNPAGLHLTINHAHVASADQFLRDLAESAEACRRGKVRSFIDRSRFALLGGAVKVLPSSLVTKLTSVASSMMNLGSGGGLPQRSAAMYGMMAALPNRGDLETLVIDALDRMTRPDEAPASPPAEPTSNP